MQETIAFMNDLADEAGKVIRRYFRQNFETLDKARHDPVTEADKATETALRAMIADRYPDDAIQGEEFGLSEGRSGRTWVIDPIDGTRSFICGVPLFGMLLGVLQDGEPVAGVIRMPALGEVFAGARGRGATMNGRPIACRRSAGPATARLHAPILQPARWARWHAPAA